LDRYKTQSVTILGGCGPCLRLEEDTVAASEHVRVLGVTISSDLSLVKHVSNVCAAGFFRLRQLRRVRRSLDSESAAALVHAFVSSRVDYCNAVYAGAPKNITDWLQPVLNAAAHVVSDMRKFDHGLSRLMHNELHWLDVSDRVKLELGVLMYRFQHNQATRYMMYHCSPVSDVVFPPASAFGQQSPTVRATLPAQHVRPSGVFCCWPDCLELIARRPSGSGVLC